MKDPEHIQHFSAPARVHRLEQDLEDDMEDIDLIIVHLYMSLAGRMVPSSLPAVYLLGRLVPV